MTVYEEAVCRGYTGTDLRVSTLDGGGGGWGYKDAGCCQEYWPQNFYVGHWQDVCVRLLLETASVKGTGMM
jgi:hypothetical protein